MQPLIGPPIYVPAHLFANASSGIRIFAVALLATSLVFHIVFLTWGYLFLRRWGREIDVRRRRREDQERKLDDPMLQLRAASEQLRETVDQIRNAAAAS